MFVRKCQLFREEEYMVIQHVMAAGNALRQTKINGKQTEKSTKCISSGYRINCAADNAAGLAISEKMRGQIRGLSRADNNIEEGIAYVKTADGVLNEVTSIVHRMRELTVQALNDTNTEDDKMQIQQEIDQLSHEITKISRQTEYNTEKMFTPNEEVFAKLNGGKNWDENAAHKVLNPNNTLDITLPAGYDPSDVTVTVPEGSYTTYELVETIDELLEGQAPDNTYFLMEYEDGGSINLVFEGGTDIERVNGGLSYLFFDTYGGAGVGDLIGTTKFDDAFPLNVVAGMNDILKFSVDKLDGSPMYDVSIQLDPGKYTKNEVIDALNRKLLEAGHPEVQAVSYGANNIELTAGTSLITGLKGNMFRIDSGSLPYDSVFYDNVQYGSVTNTAASISGKAYYSSTATVSITSSNNQLGIKGGSDTNYTTITIPEGNYTIKDLAGVLNNALGSDSSRWKFESNNRYLSSGNVVLAGGYYDYLVLRSVDTGDEATIELDTSSSAYDTLFTTTNSQKRTTPDTDHGHDAYLLGGKYLSATPITLGAAGETICLDVDGNKETLTLSKNSYASLNDLLTEINSQIANSSLNGMIKAQSNSNRIQFVADQISVSSIKFQNYGGTAYTDLFLGKNYSWSYNDSASGTTTKQQGETAYIETPATLTLDNPIQSGNIVVNSTNNTFNFTLNKVSKSIKLEEGIYTASSLISEMNQKFASGGIGLTASLVGNKVTFTTTQKGKEVSLGISSYYNPAIRILMTPDERTSYSSISTLTPAYILGKTIIDSSNTLTIDGSNNDLELVYKDSDGEKRDTLIVPQQEYSSASALVAALNDQIRSSSLNGAVKAVEENKAIKLVTDKSGSDVSFTSVSGGFYDNVLCKVETSSVTSSIVSKVSGSTNLQQAYVVGRADIKNNSVEIKQGVNDVLAIDFTYVDSTGNNKTDKLETKIPPGTYTGEQIAKLLTDGAPNVKSFTKQLEDNGYTGFTIEAAIGAHNTGVVGSNDANALSFTLKQKNPPQPIKSGTYILDGVNGSAAYSVFYKTSGLPIPAYVTGSKDISDGVVITPDNNTIGFTVDGRDYDYTIPEGEYTAEEWVKKINELIDAGDDNGNVAMVETVIEDGKWKIQYKKYGAHTIESVRGTAKQDVFYGNTHGKEDMDLRIQVGANGGQELELNKLALSTALLKLDGVNVTRYSHAQFALKHMDYAINYINSKRSDYGAKQNRLEAAERLVENMGENLQAAESGIRDANIADEAMQYATLSILTQASQSMLAQASQIGQKEVTMLLEK